MARADHVIEPSPARSATVVLPVHNQADHIAGVVRAYQAALESVPLAIDFILVPNACTDASVSVCHTLALDDDVSVCVLDEGGWGKAVRAGLSRATGDLLCYSNSARTTGEMLSLVLIYAQAYPGVVVKANRRVRDSLLRRFGSLIYNLECRALFDLSVWDVNGTPKVFPRDLVALRGLSRDDDLIDAEFNLVCRRAGFAVVEVPVLSTERHGGRSTTNWRAALRMYWGAVALYAQSRGRDGG